MNSLFNLIYKPICFIMILLGTLSCSSSNEEPEIPAVDSNIILSQKELSVNSVGGKITISVYCEDYVDINIISDWIYIIDSEYINESTINYTFGIQEYNGSDIRKGEIHFFNEKESEILTIHQSGSSTVSTSLNNISFWDNGGTEVFMVSAPMDKFTLSTSCDVDWIKLEQHNNEITVHTVPLPDDNDQQREASILIRVNELNEETSITVSQKKMITVKNQSITIEEGESAFINYTINSSELESEVNFVSSDENIVRVSSNGYIVAQSPGNAIVTLLTKDGAYKASCNIFVKRFDITNHISLKIEDQITDNEKGSHTVYYTFYNKSNKTVKITTTWIYFNGNKQFGDTGAHSVSANSSYTKTSWRYASAMRVGFEVFYEYGGNEYRIYTDKMLDAYF